MWLTPSSMALCKAKALWAPVMMIMTWKNTPVGLQNEMLCSLFLSAVQYLQFLVPLATEICRSKRAPLVKWQPVFLTSCASITVPTPTVSACVGTWLMSPSKNLALAWIVSRARVFMRVLDTRLDPGSLNAMWPSGPIPCKKKIIVCETFTPLLLSSWQIHKPSLNKSSWYLQWTNVRLQPPWFSLQSRRTLSQDWLHFHPRYGHCKAGYRHAWRNWSTWMSGNFPDDLVEFLRKKIRKTN